MLKRNALICHPQAAEWMSCQVDFPQGELFREAPYLVAQRGVLAARSRAIAFARAKGMMRVLEVGWRRSDGCGFGTPFLSVISYPKAALLVEDQPLFLK